MNRNMAWVISFPDVGEYVGNRGAFVASAELAHGYAYKAEATLGAGMFSRAHSFEVIRRRDAVARDAARPKFSDDYSRRHLENKQVQELVGQKVLSVTWGNPLAGKTQVYGGVTLRCESGREFFATSHMGEYALYEVVGR